MGSMMSLQQAFTRKIHRFFGLIMEELNGRQQK
jgi:hypothetical protein